MATKPEEQLTKHIVVYRATLIGLMGILTLWLGIILVVGYRAYRLYQASAVIGQEETGLLKSELEELEQILQQRRQPLETELEIRYGRDIGKLEPFE